MLRALAHVVDRQIANVLLSRAYRRWWFLGVVPRTWVRSLIMPAATLVRRNLSCLARIGLMTACELVALVLLLGGSS